KLIGVPSWIGELIGLAAMVIFLVIAIGYGIKIYTSRAAVKAEFLHPIAGNLFGTFFISLLLLPIFISRYQLGLARGVWAIGVVGMIIFALYIVSRWLGQRQQPAHATPAWIVPVVGLIDIPLAVPYLQLHNMHEIMLFAFSVGIFFAIPLFTLIFSRLMFEEPLPVLLQPSLLILLAPFSVGFSSYVTTFGVVDQFASILYMLTLFILCVLVIRLRYIAKACPFRLSWWSVGFPLASAVGCTLKYAEHNPGLFTISLAVILLLAVSALIFWMALYTIISALKGNLKLLAG
ncbi:MAG: SLAC1 anion channel family protein, partial [Plesiomonas sp.]